MTSSLGSTSDIVRDERGSNLLRTEDQSLTVILTLLEDAHDQLQQLEKTPSRDRLDDIISSLQDIRGKVQSEELLSRYSRELSQAYRTRYENYKVQGDLGTAVKLAREAVAVLPDEHPDCLDALLNLAGCRRSRYAFFGQTRDLKELYTLSEVILSLCPPDHPKRLEALNSTAEDLYMIYRRTNDRPSLDTAISIREQILALIPANYGDEILMLRKTIGLLRDRFTLAKAREDIDRAVSLARRQVQALMNDPVVHTASLGSLAGCVITRFITFEEKEDIEEAISLRVTILTSFPPGTPSRSGHLFELVDALHMQLGNSEPTIEDVTRLLVSYEELIAISSADDPDRHSMCTGFADALKIRMRLVEPSSEDWDRYVALREDALRSCPETLQVYAWRLDALALAMDQGLSANGKGSIDRIIDLRVKAVALAPGGAASFYLLMDTGGSFEKRYRQTSQLEDLAQAMSYYKQIIALDNFDDQDLDDKLEVYQALGCALYEYCEDFARGGDYKYLIALHRQALTLVPSDHPSRPAFLGYLARALQLAHTMEWQPTYIEEVVALYREAAEKCPEGSSDRAGLLWNVSRVLMVLYLLFHEDAVLDEAMYTVEEVTKLLPVAHEKYFTALCDLAGALVQRYRRYGDSNDLVRASTLTRDMASKDMPVDDRLRCADAEGMALRALYVLDEDTTHLKGAVEAYDKVISLSCSDEGVRRDCLRGLATVLTILYECTGDRMYVDRAIALRKDIVKEMPESHPDCPAVVGELGGDLMRLYRSSRDMAFLEEAIAICRHHVDAKACLGVGRVQLLATYSLLLGCRHGQYRDPRDDQELISVGKEMLDFQKGSRLDFSVALFKDVGATMADDQGSILDAAPDTAVFLTGFSDRLLRVRTRGSQHLKQFQKSHNPSDIDQAIAIYLDALTWLPEAGTQRRDIQYLLATVHRERFKITQSDIRDLDEAIRWTTLSIDGIDGTSARFSAHEDIRRLAVAELIIERHTRDDGDQKKLQDAWSLLEGVATSPYCDASVRFHAAMVWALRAANANFVEQALKAFRLLFTILPHLAWLGSDTRASIRAIYQARYLPVEAAMFALRHASVEEAVEFLEAGRTVIWTQATRLRRPLDALNDVHPVLASRLHGLSERIQTWSDSPATAAADQEHSLLSTLRTEWFDAVDEARKLPGLAHFLGTRPFSALSEAAREGPVVLLLDHESCCTAIILPSADANPVCVPLTITVKKLQALHTRMRKVLHSRGAKEAVEDGGGASSRAPRFTRPAGAQPAELDVLGILWDDVVRPVVQHLSGIEPPPPEARPRLWWCCVGYFSFMPVHAAGRYRRGTAATCVSDFFISSYAPTLATLIEARQRPPSDSAKVLPVIYPKRIPPHFDALPNTQNELRAIYGSVPRESLLSLDDSGDMDVEGCHSTPANVLAKLAEATIFHLACHGVQEDDPLDSGFVLRDGARLTIDSLMKISLPRASVAFLSACHTAASDLERPDEAINLANAMLFAGFPSVVATMWPMGDPEGPVLAQSMYNKLFDGSAAAMPNSRVVATALDATVRDLRKTVPWERWAVFIHIGA